MFTGAIPFNNSLPAVAALAIMGGERPPRPTHLALTDRLWLLLQRCWNQDPQLRPNISEVLRVLVPSVPYSIGLPTLDDEKELPGSGATSPAISFCDEKFTDPPRKIRAKEIWVCRLVRNARKMFKAISSILCGL